MDMRRGEELPQMREPMSKERDGFSPVSFDGDRFRPVHTCAGLDGERCADGEDGHQRRELSGIGEMGRLHVEAARFEIGEQGFDGPAFAVCGERTARPGQARERKQFISFETQDDDANGRSIRAESAGSLEEDALAGFEVLRDAADRPSRIAVAGNILVLAQAQCKRDFLLRQIAHPLFADELPVAGERSDLHIWKDLMQPVEQLGALIRRGVAGLGQEGPQKRHADAVPHHRDHQDVDARPAEIPVGAVNRQHPGLVLQSQESNDNPRRIAGVDLHHLKEAIETPAHRCGLRARRRMRRQSPQANRAVPENQQHQPDQRFLSCVAQTNMILC